MNSNFLFDQTFRQVRARARGLYFKILVPWYPEVPVLNKERVSISRVGWGHLHKNTRSRLEMISRYFALPKLVAILSDSKARVENEKGTDGVSDLFSSVIWKGEEKKKESKEKRAVSRLYPRCRGVVTSQLLFDQIISQVEEMSTGTKKEAVSRLNPRRRRMGTSQKITGGRLKIGLSPTNRRSAPVNGRIIHKFKKKSR